ncbi:MULTISPECIES: HPr family phosphocarrier protein [Gulosibacter]|uniref:HPr family phosphocarrier protein n=1 Tax=Gulosibacter TaxID=256818 RepID=UPI0018692F32|nr:MULTISPECIES: HPr family phosphocarrier protein [Gulosibacter]
MSDQISRSVTLNNETGLHARPASEFVKEASKYDAKVTVNGVDAKSLLGIMAMGATKGTELALVAEGPEAEAAVNGLVALVESNFGE